MSVEEGDIQEVFVTTGSELVLDESVSPDDEERGGDERGFDARAPSLSKRDAIDACQDVDAERLPPQHNDLIGLREISRARCNDTKPEVDERSPEGGRVSKRWIHEHVEIFREPRLAVACYRVSSDQKESERDGRSAHTRTRSSRD